MKLHRTAFILGLLAILAVAIQCSEDNRGINFFTANQDVQFGASMDSMIMEDPEQFPLLEKSQYPTAYQHLERIRDEILASGQLDYADDFPWTVKIIHNDTTLNAFAAPGGYMYFYTGIIHFLDDEAEFAGVMAHEMAHCDRRHSTAVLTRQYTFAILLGDDPGLLAEIAAGLATGLTDLAFSRENEKEADHYAVKYLSSTDYDPRGLAGFFEKLEGPTSYTPIFLSTHPAPENRIANIYADWELFGGNEGQRFADRYQSFKNSLPAPVN